MRKFICDIFDKEFDYTLEGNKISVFGALDEYEAKAVARAIWSAKGRTDEFTINMEDYNYKLPPFGVYEVIPK